ncbi:GNAT family N-acetyltransferase [Gabonibacter chumensis]|uniref:GNAT family N-acetyltransferase n=1 Tax=Gabonibacter chumensis TaxID=2972474 RepID=UPI0025736F60|nr:GNAT family N-acetyltransferase [Gabonibacter chumensis]MCR9011846.1 N-acetyltransferase [Gabonibacter chumensis]
MEIIHNTHDHKFEIRDGRHTAVVEYRPFKEGIDIIHTYVPGEMENKGYASALVKHALEYARENHLKVITTCPFSRSYVARHPEYQNLIFS